MRRFAIPASRRIFRLLGPFVAVAGIVLPQAGTASAAPMLPTPVLAQDENAAFEPAKTSRVTGLPLPVGAIRILKNEMVDELARNMKTTADEGGFITGKVEGLFWGGKGHTTQRTRQIEQELISTFKKNGFQYEQVGEREVDGMKIILFVAGKPDGKVAALGFFAPQDTGFLLAVTKIAKKGTPLTDTPLAGNVIAEPTAKPAAAGKKLPPAEQKRLDSELETAIEGKSVEEVKALLAKGASANGRAGAQSFLQRAVVGGNKTIVSLLLDAGANPDYGDGQSIAPLFTAALVNESEILELLLAAGANPNAALPDNGFTPLHGAALMNRVALIERLLEKGADATIRDKSGRTPRQVAESSRHTGAAEILQKAEEKAQSGG